MTELTVPDLADVLAARQRIAPYLRPTPLFDYPALDAATGARLRIKHENHQPVGAFKVRGGVNLISQLPEEQRKSAVISASTGNHGQSIAYAARLFGVRAIICVPGAGQSRAEGPRVRCAALGAPRWCSTAATSTRPASTARSAPRREGLRYVHSGNEPALIAGVATWALGGCWRTGRTTEMIVVPIGGGSGASGACVVAAAVRPSIEVIGVQAEEAPAARRSWAAGELVTAPSTTSADVPGPGRKAGVPSRVQMLAAAHNNPIRMTSLPLYSRSFVAADGLISYDECGSQMDKYYFNHTICAIYGLWMELEGNRPAWHAGRSSLCVDWQWP